MWMQLQARLANTFNLAQSLSQRQVQSVSLTGNVYPKNQCCPHRDSGRPISVRVNHSEAI